MTYTVEFSLEAAAELLRIAGVVGSASTIRAADSIRSGGGWRLILREMATSCQKACTTSTRNLCAHFSSSTWKRCW